MLGSVRRGVSVTRVSATRGRCDAGSGAVDGGIREAAGGRGAVYVRQAGDELARLHGAAGLAPVLPGRTPAAQPLHPVPVHPESAGTARARR